MKTKHTVWDYVVGNTLRPAHVCSSFKNATWKTHLLFISCVFFTCACKSIKALAQSREQERMEEERVVDAIAPRHMLAMQSRIFVQVQRCGKGRGTAADFWQELSYRTRTSCKHTSNNNNNMSSNYSKLKHSRESRCVYAMLRIKTYKRALFMSKQACNLTTPLHGATSSSPGGAA